MTDSLTTITLNTPASRTMRLLIGAVDGSEMIIRVPLYNRFITELDTLFGLYGGIFVMDVTHFIETHECVPLFVAKDDVLQMALSKRVLVLIPQRVCIVQKMYKTFRDTLPLFMFSQELYLMFVKAVLVLEYSKGCKEVGK
jgi:hypothetical protein